MRNAPHHGRGDIVYSLLEKTDKARAEFYRLRVPEELYDTRTDPGCHHNLAKAPKYQKILASFRKKMRDALKSTADHELENFVKFIKKK